VLRGESLASVVRIGTIIAGVAIGVRLVWVPLVTVFRTFRGNGGDPGVQFVVEYVQKKKNKLSGDVELQVTNFDTTPHSIEIVDNAYKKPRFKKGISSAGSGKNEIHIVLDLRKSHGWYDFTVKVAGNATFERRYAGHVETGERSTTDPQMGDMV